MERQPSKAAVRDPQEARLRAYKMLEYRLQNGASMKQIAEKFNVSVATTERVLSYARKAGLVAEAEDRILNELVPAAHKAIMTGLTDTEHPQDAAKLGIEVFKGTVPSFGKRPQGKSTSSNDEDALSRAIAEAREQYGHVLDGEILPHPQLAAEATAPKALGEGDSGELYQPLLFGPLDDAESEAPMGETDRERVSKDA